MSVLVTVGTTCFDKLVEVACRPEFHKVLFHLGYRSLTVQYGAGAIVPSFPISDPSITYDSIYPLSFNAFTFKPDLTEDISSADLVISHGGAGTCLQALTPPGARRLIVVVNDTLAGNHQLELALTLARGRHALVSYPDLLLDLLQTGVNEKTCPFPDIPFESFSADVVNLLGPSLPPEEVGFIGFKRGDPKRLLHYLNMRLNIT